MDGNDRSLAAFAMLGHATFHAYELAIPVFVVVWLDAFDVSPALLGTVVAAGYALVGVGAPVSGVLSDAVGSKPLVLASVVGMGGSFLLLAATNSVATLALALLLWGAAASLYHPAGLSLVSRGARRRGAVLAYHGAAGNVGTVVGPLVAIVLLALFGWRVAAAALVAPAGLAVLLALALSFDEYAGVDAEGPTSADGRNPDSLREFLAGSRTLFAGGFALVFLIQLVYGLYYRGAFTFLPEVLSALPFGTVDAFGRSFGPGEYLYSGLLLLGVAGQYAGGMLSERVAPEKAPLPPFLALVAASLLFVPAATAGLVPLMVVCAVIGFCVYAFAPIGQALVAEYVPAGKHGLSFGYVYLGTFGVGAVGASAAGVVLSVADSAALFVMLACFAAVCALLSALLWRRA